MQPVSHSKSDMVGDFLKGAVKGAIYFGLMVGATFAVFSLFGLGMPITLEPLQLLALTVTTGVLNGTLRAYHGATVSKHMSHGNMREAQITQSSPTLVPMLGLAGAEHSLHVDHALEVEHTPSRKWTDSVGQRGDAVQQILQNGSMSDGQRAAAILREREARATAGPQATI